MTYTRIAGIGLIVFTIVAAILSIFNELYVRLFQCKATPIDIYVTVSMILIATIGILMIVFGKKEEATDENL